MYTGADRSMLFATIVRYPASGSFMAHNIDFLYCFELNSLDPLTDADKIVAFYRKIKANWMTERNEMQLYFHPTSLAQAKVVKEDKAFKNVPIRYTEDIY